jgi:hypothetical protein
MKPIDIVIETGQKRTFASALDWPGWSRSGKDEESALRTLLDYGPRYAHVLQHMNIEFQPPSDPSVFLITERSEGGSGTDFGAPEIPAEAEKGPLDSAELERSKALLLACWQAFDRAIRQATGKELRTGPRGGGRDLEKIMGHVIGADQAYLRRLAWKVEGANERDLEAELQHTRQAILEALETAVKDGLPEQGPRGGKIWPPRYFVRRVAWHVLDHTWEIEDRIIR